MASHGQGQGQRQGQRGQGGQEGQGRRRGREAQADALHQVRLLLRLQEHRHRGEQGKGREHCTNPACERSLHFALLSPEQQRILLAANLAAKEAAAAEARLAATRAEMAAIAAAAFPKASPAAAPAAWVADATVVIDDTQPSPLTPADAAAAAGHSDTDASSPDGQPTNPASWAQIGAYGKSRGPPTKDPSPANLAFMGGHLPKGPPAAGAAVETVDLLSQTHADAGGSPSPNTAQAAGPGAPPATDADALAASLAAMWPDGQGKQAEMLQWAVNELATRRADAQRDTEALHTAKQQMAAAHDQLRVAALGTQEGGDIRLAQQRRIAELAQREASRRARLAQFAQALDRAVDALAEARAVYNSLLEF